MPCLPLSFILKAEEKGSLNRAMSGRPPATKASVLVDPNAPPSWHVTVSADLESLLGSVI